MNSLSPSINAFLHSFPRLLKILGLLLLMGNLASCSSGSNSSATFQPNHWRKVSDNPPTYFPKGVPAGHATGFNDGSWVHSGDEVKTRYFIPSQGVATESLVAEAMSTMTANGRMELNKNKPGDAQDSMGTGVKNGFKAVGYTVGYAFMAIFTGGMVTPGSH